MKFLFVLSLSLTLLLFLFVQPIFATDTIAPITTLGIDPTSATGSNGWYNQSVDLTINASDSDSGVAKISYTLDTKAKIDKTIESSVNLIDNPSFEEHHNLIPYYWDRAVYSSNIYVSSNYKVDGLYSLRFNSNIWPVNYLTNESYFITASSFQTYFFSLWLKTNMIGIGTNYEIMAKVNGTNQLIYRSPTYSNYPNFTFINKSFTTPSGTTAIFINLYSLGWGNTYVDNLYMGQITSETSVKFNVSEEGQHTIKYNATDQAGNIGSDITSNFKIDITSPSDWQNFTYSEVGNDHTLKLNVDISDIISGIDITSGFFQYYIEDVGWGVYQNLNKCTGTFLLNQWAVPTITYITNPSKAHILTPTVDFCNSNWLQDKKIRFKIKDIAGNEAISPEFSINSPWLYASEFDIASNYSIAFSSIAKIDNIAQSKNNITGVNSVSGITVKNYVNDTEISAQSLISQATFETLPENKLPDKSGKYKFVGNMTLDNKTLNGYDTKTICSVVAIDGSLTISKDYTLKDSSSCLIFLITGNLNISSSVNSVEGFFILDGTFDSASANKTLTIKGGVVAREIKLLRSLAGKKNLTDPSEYFDYDLNLLFNASGLVSNTKESTFWYEL